MQTQTLSYDLRTRSWSKRLPPLDSERTLVVVFGAPGTSTRPELFVELRAAYPRSVILGCSTAGEILGATVRDDTLAVSVTRFEHTALRWASFAVEDLSRSRSVGRSVARALDAPDLRAVFVLADGLHVDGTELMGGVNEGLPSRVVVTGGLAGDGTRFGETWICVGATVRPRFVAAVGFYGNRVLVTHGSKGGWERFGPERTVTRSDGNVLYELDGRPALALFQDFMGPKAAGLLGTGVLFPLALRLSGVDDRIAIRTVLAVDEARQTLTFAGDVPENVRVQLMTSPVDRLIAGAADAATLASGADTRGAPTLALAVSGVGRRLVLGDRTGEELEAVRDALPAQALVVGFYAYGELSPSAGGPADLHHPTMTVTTFTEPEIADRLSTSDLTEGEEDPPTFTDHPPLGESTQWLPHTAHPDDDDDSGAPTAIRRAFVPTEFVHPTSSVRESFRPQEVVELPTAEVEVIGTLLPPASFESEPESMEVDVPDPSMTVPPADDPVDRPTMSLPPLDIDELSIGVAAFDDDPASWPTVSNIRENDPDPEIQPTEEATPATVRARSAIPAEVRQLPRRSGRAVRWLGASFVMAAGSAVLGAASVGLVGSLAWMVMVQPPEGWQTADHLPPPWSERPITVDEGAVVVVGKGGIAPTEDAALALAREQAVEVLLGRVLNDLRGQPVFPFLEAQNLGAKPFGAAGVRRYEAQLGAEAGLERVAVAFCREEGGVEAVGQYRLDRAQYDAVLAAYGRVVSFGGLTVARLFPGVPAEPAADLVVIAADPAAGGLVAGDLLVRIGGGTVKTLAEVEQAWSQVPAGAVSVEVTSGGIARVVELQKPTPGG